MCRQWARGKLCACIPVCVSVCLIRVSVCSSHLRVKTKIGKGFTTTAWLHPLKVNTHRVKNQRWHQVSTLVFLCQLNRIPSQTQNTQIKQTHWHWHLQTHPGKPLNKLDSFTYKVHAHKLTKDSWLYVCNVNQMCVGLCNMALILGSSWGQRRERVHVFGCLPVQFTTGC